MTEQLPLNIAQLHVKLRVEDYLLLDDAGAFDSYRKTELIGGEIYFMNAQHRPHARMKTRLAIQIAEVLRRLDLGLEAIVEGSISIPPHDVPEPDIVVTSEPEGEGLIPLASVRLIVEVSDATVQFDLTRKAKLYACNNVSEYWVIDVNAGVVHQMWAPAAEDYTERQQVPFGQIIHAVTISDLRVDTAYI